MKTVKRDLTMSAAIKVQIGADAATQDLWRLAETDDIEQLKYVLARGADINACNSDGVTALMRAAYCGRAQMACALVDHGADLNAARTDGFTPLMLAAFFGHADVVRALLERGADLSKVTRFGASADVWATARSFYEIAQYLEQARSGAHEFGYKPSLPENAAAEEGPALEPVSIGQPGPTDSDLRMEAPRVTSADQLILDGPEEQEVEQNTAEPPVVKTLKDPPEIWELVQVHEMPGRFDPGLALVSHLSSRKAKLILLTLTVVLISAVCTFAVLRLRGFQVLSGATAQGQEERGTNQSVPASQASKTPTSAGSVASDTTNSPPENPVSASEAPSIQPTGVSVNDSSKRTAPFASPTTSFSGRKAVGSNRQNPESQSRLAAAETAASAVARPQTPPIASVTESDKKTSSDSALAKPKSNSTLSPQLIAPPTTSSTPKAKVIQWP